MGIPLLNTSGQNRDKMSDVSDVTQIIFEIDDLACNAYFRATAEAAAAQRYLRSEWVSKSRRGVLG